MTTKEQYLNELKERRFQLKMILMIDRHDNKFVEPDDKRYRERRLINQILRLHRRDNN